jgi:hypothetical protein
MRQKLPAVAVLLILCLPWVATSVHAQVTTVQMPFTYIDTTGGTSFIGSWERGVIYAFPITIVFPGLVWAIGVNWAGTVLGAVRVALYTNNYTAGSDRPSSLLTDSATVFVAMSGGWQDIPVALRSVTVGNYWVAIQISAVESVFAIASTRTHYYRGFGSFDSSYPYSNYTLDYEGQWNMRVIYTVHFPIRPLEQQNQIKALPVGGVNDQILNSNFLCKPCYMDRLASTEAKSIGRRIPKNLLE